MSQSCLWMYPTLAVLLGLPQSFTVTTMMGNKSLSLYWRGYCQSNKGFLGHVSLIKGIVFCVTPSNAQFGASASSEFKSFKVSPIHPQNVPKTSHCVLQLSPMRPQCIRNCLKVASECTQRSQFCLSYLRASLSQQRWGINHCHSNEGDVVIVIGF